MTRSLLASVSAVLAATVVTTVSTSADAACGPNESRCSEGSAAGLKYTHEADTLPSAQGMSFVWVTSVPGVNETVQIDVGLKLGRRNDDDKGGMQPIFIADMDRGPALRPKVKATWDATTKRIAVVRAESTTNDASLDVRYTLRPQVDLKLGGRVGPKGWNQAAATAEGNQYDPERIGTQNTYNGNPDWLRPGSVWGNAITVSWSAEELLAQLITNNSNVEDFGVDGDKSHPFAPWKFDGTSVTVPGGSSADSSFFTYNFNLGTYLTNNKFGVAAEAEPIFTYRTTSVTESVGGTVLSDTTGYEVPEKQQYGNALEIPVTVKGGVKVRGLVRLKPYLFVGNYSIGPLSGALNQEISITNTTDQWLARNFAIPSTNDDDYIEFEYPATTLRIPLPNVRVGTTTLDIEGTSTTANRTLAVENQGEAPLTIQVVTTGNISSATSSQTIQPGTTFDLTIRATGEAGAIDGTIVIHTNDPDTPQLTLTATGELYADNNGGSSGSNGGASSGGRGDGGDGDNNAEGDDTSGCGCRTAGSPISTGGNLGLVGGLALGAMALIRRRRNG